MKRKVANDDDVNDDNDVVSIIAVWDGEDSLYIRTLTRDHDACKKVRQASTE